MEAANRQAAGAMPGLQAAKMEPTEGEIMITKKPAPTPVTREEIHLGGALVGEVWINGDGRRQCHFKASLLLNANEYGPSPYIGGVGMTEQEAYRAAIAGARADAEMLLRAADRLEVEVLA
jgi:hypothetical protein